MFDVKVDLCNREVVFDPPIQCDGSGGSIQDILLRIVADFISLSNTLSRLDGAGQGGDYLVEVKDQFVLFGALQQMTNNFNDTVHATGDYLQQYSDKQFLWKETLKESFQAFLDTGIDPREQKHVKLNDDGEEEEDETFAYMANKILEGVKTKRPSLDQFDEKITFLTKIRDDIVEASLKPTIDIGWLRVNATPLIKELEKTANSWIAAYTGFLLENTTKEIENIEEFIKAVATGTTNLPKKADSEADKKQLKKVMGHLRDVKMIKDRTFNEIEPMKQAVLLLKKHQCNFPKDQDFVIKLENAKSALVEVSEKALGPVKEAILPLQTQEAKAIKQRLVEFSKKVGDFRTDFQQNNPYHITDLKPENVEAQIANAYRVIQLYHEKTNEITAEQDELNDLETLFDMQKSTYKQLKDCKNELITLKQMWDLIALIDYQFRDWTQTKWDKINASELEQLIREMQKQQCNPQHASNKDIRSWKAFQALVDRVKNMGAVLPLVTQLRSPFVVERHWKKLMGFTGKTVPHKSADFCLADLMKLELHKFAEEVNELVEGAQKEDKIDKKLQQIIKFWETQCYSFTEWKDVPLLTALEETVDAVEVMALDLNGMLSSKDVGQFKEEVSLWREKLKIVENVTEDWVKVQRNWMRLEPIFLASADIRGQLPDDTKKFESVDAAFKDMMREAKEEPNVVNACTVEGRADALKEFMADIDACQKALTEYLGAKKNIFPRFYFVSDQALLDILSNGNNPEIVDQYLGDCFDGLKSLQFMKGEGEPKPAKRAKGMISKERERVDFFDIYEALGPVEIYLGSLETFIQAQLHRILMDAYDTAQQWGIDTERHIWLE